ncbi:MAG TPA: 4'-phosphopantetheinyl transferase superfamily protein, partial [Corynebacterium pollutisoli]|nr:4'-phosphopantetheinyl transferase superfamily protein [Corynebacterium pollutisoli]
MLNSSLFPDAARFCYVITDRERPDLQNYHGLHPLEQALVSHSVDVRKAEFGDARWCAHQALRDLGEWDNEPILRGERGMPLWPQDITGSMTHTEGFRAAVVAPRTHVRSMGLDAEPADPLPREVIGSIARPGEMPQLERLRNEGIECADRLLFCAKEATYKAWFPMT